MKKHVFAEENVPAFLQRFHANIIIYYCFSKFFRNLLSSARSSKLSVAFEDISCIDLLTHVIET